MNVRTSSSRQSSPKLPRRATVVSASTKLGLARRDARRLQKVKRSAPQPHRQLSLRDIASDSDLRQQAWAMAQRGNYLEAIALFDWLIENNPNSAVDYNNRGLVYFQWGQVDKALADYNHAIFLNPRLANVYNNRANYYAAQGELVEAIADYDTAIDLDPANLRAWLNQGITFRDLELYERAIENFELALQLLELSAPSPTLEGHLYAERGRAHHLAGDWNCAIADYRRALIKLPLPSTASGATKRLRLQTEGWLSSLVCPL
jgi:tetratricopeptide (TPR) repeat protein